ncbi:MAG: rhodanese-like domain-containing protein [Proteobacteria bacterium]|nr:MAG: rhodanese-like domain-containing protein [Pseudomonadota bacterium]
MSKVKYINAAELKALLAKKPEITICDIRGVGEFNSGHIQNAINIPVSSFDRAIFKPIKDKDSIVFHCKSGTRTRINEAKLTTAPFKNIYVLKNGISEWQQSGGEVIHSAGAGNSLMSNLRIFIALGVIGYIVYHIATTLH